MPRHVTSDAHEWVNEIATVPSPRSGEPTVKGTDLKPLAGKEDPVEFYSSLHRLCGMGGVG